MQNENFGIIFLIESEYLLLEQANKMGIVLAYPVPSHLLDVGLLKKINNNSNQYLITDKGVRYIEYYRKKEKQDIKNKKSNDFQFWFPIIITNLISSAALVISIIQLLTK